MHRCLWLVSGLVAVSCGDSKSPARPDAGPPDQTVYLDPLEPRGSLNAGSALESAELAVVDGLLLACTETAGLLVIDRASMTELASLDVDGAGGCHHLAVDGDIAYASHHGSFVDEASVVAGYDLSQSPPTLTGSARATGLHGIAADGGRVYVAARSSGVRIYDSNLSMLGTVSGLANAWDVAADGTSLWIADASGELVAADVSNPSSPAITRRLDVDGSPQSIAIAGDSLVVGAGVGGLLVIDRRGDLSQLAQSDTPGSATQVAASGSVVVVADWFDARVYDLSDPTAPALITTERVDSELPGGLRGVAIDGASVYLGEWSDVLSYELFADRVAPDVRTADPSIAFSSIDAGDTDAHALILSNDGTTILDMDIAATGARFSIDQDRMILVPGESAALEVTFDAASATEVAGTITIDSRDPDEPTISIPVTGNGPGLAVGQPAPEVALSLLGGGEWRSSQQLGNIVVLAYFATY